MLKKITFISLFFKKNVNPRKYDNSRILCIINILFEIGEKKYQNGA